MEASSVEVLFNDFWTWRLQRSPEFSTLTGSKANDGILETFTEARFEEDRDTCLDYVKKATVELDKCQDPEVKLNLRFFIAELQTFIDGYKYKGFYFPVNFMEGVQVDFQRLAEWASLDTVSDYENIITRYTKFSELANQIVQMMRGAVSNKLTNSSVSMKGVVEQCQGHLGDPKDTVFYKPFLEMSGYSEEEVARLQKEALSAIKDHIQPGFTLLKDFLVNEYAPATRPEIGVTSLPGIGQEFYKACLAFHTSTDLTAEEIHQKGLNEVERIEEEMRQIVKEMGHNMSLQEFADMVRKDKSNFFDSPTELLDAFKNIIENQILPRIQDIFHSKPAGKLEIVETPASTPDAPSAYYIAGTPDGKRPGRLFVNTHKYDSEPKYELISLALHEANPGHHLQACYMLEKQDWPLFRKVMEDRVYCQVPSRFPINTAYTEGWGLYSETLGKDLGLYGNPMDRYGHLSAEIFRACRLVVDTGMHALGWSREEAAKYMLQHTASSPESIRDEVDRYVTWPGQATGYKIGQMKIRELRSRAETELGDKFNIKDFHEIVLQAAGPLYILEEQVDLYINNNR